MRNRLALLIVVMGCSSSNVPDFFDEPVTTGAAGGVVNSGDASAGSSGSNQAIGGGAGTSGSLGSTPSEGTSGSATAGTGAGDSGGKTSAGGAGDQGGASDAGGDSGGMAGALSCKPEVLELCDGLDNDGCDGVDDGAACPPGCHGFADDSLRGYMICVSEEGLAFDDARAFCQAHDVEFDLVRIDDEDENSFLVAKVVTLTEQAIELWIGASDAEDEDEWLWLDGALFYDHGTGMVVEGGYENWADMRPNDGGLGEDCAALNVNLDGFHGLWNDESCDNHWISFVCEGP